MNRTLLSSVSLLSLLVASNGIAMKKEIIEMPLRNIEPQEEEIKGLRTFLKDYYDANKYYASDSPEVKKIVPIFKTIAAKVEAEQNSREEDALALVTDCSRFDIERRGWSPLDCKVIPSLAVVKRYGLNTNALDNNLLLQQKELAKNDVKEIVLTFDQVDKLRTIKDNMKSKLNIHETFSGNYINRQDLVDAFNKLDGIPNENMIVTKGISLDAAFKEASKANN